MPFGLKNAGATYQRAMTALFHDLMHKEAEVYVYDMIVKSRNREDRLLNLQKGLIKSKFPSKVYLRHYIRQVIRMNPKSKRDRDRPGKGKGDY